MEDIVLKGINKLGDGLKIVHYEVNGKRFKTIVPIEDNVNRAVKQDWKRRKNASINL